jgi:phospholipid N-methyltransferase
MFENGFYLLSERLQFFASFLRSPRQVGSITPSSRFLAEAMVRSVQWDKAQVVVELGAGTGVFTRLIDERKRANTHVFVFEQDRKLRDRLQEKFSDFHIQANAVDLLDVLNQRGIMAGEVDVIISGLPFAAFPSTLRNMILDRVYQALKPGGKFITFQYSLQMKKQLEQRFQKVTISFVPLNLPPALVYTCVKRF